MMPSPPIRVPLQGILAAAARHPHAEALRHKRRGTWVSWSWGDVAAWAEQLGQTLQKRHPNATLVAISGDYAPNLLAFALAAARVGAAVVPVPTSLTQPDLAEWLAGARPDLVFVGLREQVGAWRAALRQAGQAPELIADFHLPWGHPTGAGLTPAQDLFGRPSGILAFPRTGDGLWVEESTDWVDGLSYVLHVAAQTGRALVFPESRAAAGRDRQEIQPAAFALSATHYERLQRDLSARLSTGGGLAARLTRSALAAAHRDSIQLHHRWLLGRVRGPLGLARLHDLTVVAPSGDAVEVGYDLFTALGIRSGRALPPMQAELAGQPGLAFA